MAAYDHLCRNCMADRAGAEVCPVCGCSGEEPPTPGALAEGTMLQNRYLVGRVKKENGEGFRYIGYDTVLELPIKIRELFPRNLCHREESTGEICPNAGHEAVFQELAQLFLQDARIIARLREVPSLEKVLDIFQANGTAYTVAEWSEEITLRYFVERSGGVLHWNDARQLFLPIFTALTELHRQGVGHYGLSPDSIAILKDGNMRLIDFAIRPVRQLRTTVPSDLTPGCAALEQYVRNAPLTEATDVYGAAACLFFALTGDLPRNALQRQKDGKLLISTATLRQIPPHVVTALANALQVPPEQRTKTVAELEEQLSSTPAVTSTIGIEDTRMLKKISIPSYEEPESHPEFSPPPKKNLLWLWISLIVLGAAAAVAALLFFLLPREAQDTAPEESQKISSALESAQEEVSTQNFAMQAVGGSVASESELIPAPRLVGKDYTDALESARATGEYEVMLRDKIFDSTVPEGQILSQMPEAGQGMPLGGSVVVQVSQGSAQRTLPDVENLSLADACEKITAEGFTVVKVDAYSDTIEAERVIGYQNQKAGDVLHYGTQVTVLLSKGPQE